MAIISLIAAAVSVSNGSWLPILLDVALIIYIAGTWNHGFFRKRGLPQMEGPWPFLGNFERVVLGRETIQDWIVNSYAGFKGHGVFGMFQFQKPMFVMRDIDLIKAVTVKDFDHFTDHQPFTSEEYDPLFGKNLVSLNGSEWKSMRNTLSPAFTSSKMKYLFKLMDDCGSETVSFIEGEISSSSNCVFESEMKDFFTRFTNDCIATSAFGIRVNSQKERNNDFFKMGQEISVNSLRRMLLFFGMLMSPTLMAKLGLFFIPKRVSNYFHNIVQETIQERQKRSIVRPDMLQLLMQAKAGQLKAEKDDEQEAILDFEKKVLSDQDITAQALLFFLAGFDTVSGLMCLTAMCLALHPEVQERLQREIDDVMEARSGSFSYEAVQDMKYLDMVVSEVLRRYFILLMDRKCVKDYSVPATGKSPAFTIRKGEILIIPQGGIHMDPEYWPNPEKFDPERFSDENKGQIKPFTYLPFGVGPRMCIGNRFALVETKIIFVHLLRHFNVVATSKTPKDIIFEKFSFNNSIEGGYWVGFQKRKK